MKRNYIIPKSIEVLIHTEELIANSLTLGWNEEEESVEQCARHDDNAWDTEW